MRYVPLALFFAASTASAQVAFDPPPLSLTQVASGRTVCSVGSIDISARGIVMHDVRDCMIEDGVPVAAVFVAQNGGVVAGHVGTVTINNDLTSARGPVETAMRGCAERAATIRGDRNRFYRDCVSYQLRPYGYTVGSAD